MWWYHLGLLLAEDVEEISVSGWDPATVICLDFACANHRASHEICTRLSHVLSHVISLEIAAC
jgi:hypothetical protein